MFIDPKNTTYRSLFTLSSQDVVTNWNTESSSTSLYVLKQQFHCQSQIYLIGDHINCKVLESNSFAVNSPLFSGRQLRRQADVAFRSVKVAVSFATTLVDPNGDPLKSGHSVDDLIIHLLDLMYVKYKGKASADDSEISVANNDEVF